VGGARKLDGVTTRFIALIVPLSLDTRGRDRAGVAGFPARRRTHLAVWFASFEAVMPLVGVALGRPFESAIGGAAEYVAVAMIALLAIYMLIAEEDANPERLLSLSQRGLTGAVILGISISLDELAIGIRRCKGRRCR
jgi:putative Mn2+ efflux pump MntP